MADEKFTGFEADFLSVDEFDSIFTDAERKIMEIAVIPQIERAAEHSLRDSFNRGIGDSARASATAASVNKPFTREELQAAQDKADSFRAQSRDFDMFRGQSPGPLTSFLGVPVFREPNLPPAQPERWERREWIERYVGKDGKVHHRFNHELRRTGARHEHIPAERKVVYAPGLGLFLQPEDYDALKQQTGSKS